MWTLWGWEDRPWGERMKQPSALLSFRLRDSFPLLSEQTGILIAANKSNSWNQDPAAWVFL